MKDLKFIEYNRSLRDYARENRKYSTRQEGIFWNLVLKNKRFMGYKFTRQKIIGSFILDFYCSKLLLGIEIDGGYHNERKIYDRVRDSEIFRQGILVVRITNAEINKNLEGVIKWLKEIVVCRERGVGEILPGKGELFCRTKGD